MRYTIKHLLGATALGAALLASIDAQAGGFAVREQSAVGAGDAFAGEGTTSMGLSAMYWNPAAVTQVPATSLSLPRQIEVVRGGLLAQFSPCAELAEATTSPLIVSGAAAFPLPIRTVVPPSLPGHPTDPG